MFIFSSNILRKHYVLSQSYFCSQPGQPVDDQFPFMLRCIKMFTYIMYRKLACRMFVNHRVLYICMSLKVKIDTRIVLYMCQCHTVWLQILVWVCCWQNKTCSLFFFSLFSLRRIICNEILDKQCSACRPISCLH